VSRTPVGFRPTIRDSGAGFNPELAREAQAVGLISMKERVKLVNGTISITCETEVWHRDNRSRVNEGKHSTRIFIHGQSIGRLEAHL
jgi:glucose-6-phosphate-specific signal transduction histidine kinase